MPGPNTPLPWRRVYGNNPTVADEVRRIKAAGGWVDQGRVCSVLGVSRAFGDFEFKGEGLQQFLKSGVEFGLFSEEFARSAAIHTQTGP